MIGASIPARHHQHGSLYGISREERFSRWSMADVLFLALTGKKPTEAEARPLQILIGLSSRHLRPAFTSSMTYARRSLAIRERAFFISTHR
jgi:hypothetical protein